mmetsp:Transcript_10038/g.18258  ORF Transcript_10038/g.18258 Transcript_10038/m.18258 type:complete len:388 (+) Transcript_10038:162-1325(+)
MSGDGKDREELNQELKTTVESREGVLGDLKLIIQKYTQLHTQLRRQERTLSIQANQHMKGMRALETQTKAIHDYLTRCKEMHGRMLTSITAPSWAVSHHYHMTSIEHTMGHTQPHILEVGDMIRGHLHIYAMANCTTQYRKQAELHLRKANADRAKAAEKVKHVYAKLRKVRTSIIKTLKVLNTATKTVGSNRLNIGKGTGKSVDKKKTTSASAGPHARGARGGGARNNYLHLKMRYLSSLNIEQNVEVTSSMAQADLEGEQPEGNLTELTAEQEAAFQTDLESLDELLAKYTALSLNKQKIERKLINMPVLPSVRPRAPKPSIEQAEGQALVREGINVPEAVVEDYVKEEDEQKITTANSNGDTGKNNGVRGSSESAAATADASEK